MARVKRTVGDLEVEDSMVPLQGYASSISHPFDLDDDEIDDWRYEREEALARRKPLGFAPWPEEG